MSLEQRADEIARCNRCGFCQTACPIFRATGQEIGVARGRMAILRALVEKRVEWSAEVEDALFACLRCGACTAHCFPALPVADLIAVARSEYLDRVGRSRWHRLLFRHLLPYPKRLRLAARAVALGKQTGASKLAKALGLLRALGRDLGRAEEIVAEFPPRALRDQFPPGRLDGSGPTLRIGYFVGCGSDIMAPDAAEASLALLRSVGRTVTVLENCCCGLPAETYGDFDAARELARRNVGILTSEPLDVIVTDCSSCAAFLKKYPALFPPGDDFHAMAQAVAGRVKDFVELAAAASTNGRMIQSLIAGQRTIVTYHDPCHAGRGQGLSAEPRNILKALPNVEYRELPEADWCCGGAGAYALSHYELARQVLERKIDNLQRTGAQVLATSCPACVIQLAYGVRLRKLPIRVCHISELLQPSPQSQEPGSRGEKPA